MLAHPHKKQVWRAEQSLARLQGMGARVELRTYRVRDRFRDKGDMTANPLITEGRDLGWGLMDQFGAVRALSSLARVCRGCALYCRLPWVCATLPYAVGVRGTAACPAARRSPLAYPLDFGVPRVKPWLHGRRLSAQCSECSALETEGGICSDAMLCPPDAVFRPRDGGRQRSAYAQSIPEPCA